jgi:hypothetical protein
LSFSVKKSSSTYNRHSSHTMIAKITTTNINPFLKKQIVIKEKKKFNWQKNSFF